MAFTIPLLCRTFTATACNARGAQVWTSGANQMRISKERLKLLCPDLVVFLGIHAGAGTLNLAWPTVRSPDT